jgi:hypothetical protein
MVENEKGLHRKIHKSLDEVSIFIEKQIKLLTHKIVKSTCSFDYFFCSNIWTKT